MLKININLNGARLEHETYYIFQGVLKLPIGFHILKSVPTFTFQFEGYVTRM